MCEFTHTLTHTLTHSHTLSLDRDRFISVAQRIQETRGRKGRGKPWEYYDYSDMDTLEFPEMTPGQSSSNTSTQLSRTH